MYLTDSIIYKSNYVHSMLTFFSLIDEKFEKVCSHQNKYKNKIKI